MSTISLRLPESLHQRMRELAEEEGISINQFATLAIAEKMAVMMAGDYLEQRARQGSRSKFEQALAKVPEAEPRTGDALG